MKNKQKKKERNFEYLRKKNYFIYDIWLFNA